MSLFTQFCCSTVLVYTILNGGTAIVTHACLYRHAAEGLAFQCIFTFQPEQFVSRLALPASLIESE